MSDFWVCSDPPASADIVKWCEKEVEKACLDLFSNMAQAGHFSEKKVEFQTYLYSGGDWDLEEEGNSRAIGELFEEAAHSHVAWLHNDNKRGIYGKDRLMIEAAITKLERSIANVRAMLRDGPVPT